MNSIRPITTLLEKHLPRRWIVRIFKKTEGVPLLVADPGDVDISIPAALDNRLLESIRRVE